MMFATQDAVIEELVIVLVVCQLTSHGKKG